MYQPQIEKPTMLLGENMNLATFSWGLKTTECGKMCLLRGINLTGLPKTMFRVPDFDIESLETLLIYHRFMKHLIVSRLSPIQSYAVKISQALSALLAS